MAVIERERAGHIVAAPHAVSAPLRVDTKRRPRQQMVFGHQIARGSELVETDHTARDIGNGFEQLRLQLFAPSLPHPSEQLPHKWYVPDPFSIELVEGPAARGLQLLHLTLELDHVRRLTIIGIGRAGCAAHRTTGMRFTARIERLQRRERKLRVARRTDDDGIFRLEVSRYDRGAAVVLLPQVLMLLVHGLPFNRTDNWLRSPD